MAQLETLEAKVMCSSTYKTKKYSIQIALILFLHSHTTHELKLFTAAFKCTYSHKTQMKMLLILSCGALCKYVACNCNSIYYCSRFNLFYIKIPFYSTHMNIRFNLCIFWNFYNNTLVHIIYSRIIARLHFQNQFLQSFSFFFLFYFSFNGRFSRKTEPFFAGEQLKQRYSIIWESDILLSCSYVEYENCYIT